MDPVEMVKFIDGVLEGADKVCEIGITLDDSLPPVVFVEGNLGIRKDCLKPLFLYALTKLYTLKLQYDPDGKCPKYIGEVLSISRIVLIVKGDFPVAYEMRKKLIQRGLCNVSIEIPLTSLIFTRHPKCPSGWQHRRWCIAHRKSEGLLNGLSCSEIESERELCKDMAEKHPKNYYAWVHRLWLIQFMQPVQLDDELQFTSDWLYSHVSDHSAVNHRIQVLVRILSHRIALELVLSSDAISTQKDGELPAKNTNSHTDLLPNADSKVSTELKVKLLGHMFSQCTDLLKIRPGHESLWYLRRSLLEILLTELKCCFCGTNSSNEIAEYSYGVGEEWARQGVEDSVDFNWDFFVLFIRECTICSNAGSSIKELFSTVRKFVQSERRFVNLCCDEKVVMWDVVGQRQMATRYESFLIDRIKFYWGLDCMADKT